MNSPRLYKSIEYTIMGFIHQYTCVSQRFFRCVAESRQQNDRLTKLAKRALLKKGCVNRIKNDRRDAQMLARLHRAGELTAVYVPGVEDEAMRDLTRAREDAKSLERKAKQRILAFLLRHGFRYSGKTPWSGARFRWIATLRMSHPAQQLVLQESLDTLSECTSG